MPGQYSDNGYQSDHLLAERRFAILQSAISRYADQRHSDYELHAIDIGNGYDHRFCSRVDERQRDANRVSSEQHGPVAVHDANAGVTKHHRWGAIRAWNEIPPGALRADHGNPLLQGAERFGHAHG